jgi:hypothetical protein
MKYRYRLIIFLFVFVISIFGCRTSGGPGLYGDITFPYMETDNAWNNKYADEPYVFMLTDNVVKVQEDFSYTEDIHLVMKIQKEEGKKMGEFPVTYDSSREEIKDL